MNTIFQARDAFVLMCLVTDGPLDVYSEVLEKSFELNGFFNLHFHYLPFASYQFLGMLNDSVSHIHDSMTCEEKKDRNVTPLFLQSAFHLMIVL